MLFHRRSLLSLALAAPWSATALDRWPTSVLDAWSRSTPPAARTGVVYMTIRNEGAEPDVLMAVETSIAARAELHRTVVETGVARMLPVPQLEIPPRSEVKIEPNGLHLMLIELRAPLLAGASFPIAISFKSGFKAMLDVPVRAARATGHSSH